MLGTELNNQEKLEEVYEMTLENNKILRSLRRQQYIANVFRFFYWLVILGALGGVYLYVRPIIDTFTNRKSSAAGTYNQFESLRSQLPETKLIEQFINSFKGPSPAATTTTEMPTTSPTFTSATSTP